MISADIPTPSRSTSREYFAGRLAPGPARARLRFGRSGADAPGHSDSFARARVVLSEACGRLLAGVTGGSPVLSHVALSAAFGLVSYRDSGVPRVVWAAPTSREAGGTANTLVHILSIDSTRSFKELLTQARASIVEDGRHRLYPFELLLDSLGSSAAHDLFDVVIAHASLHEVPAQVGQSLTLVLDPQPSRTELIGEVTAAIDVGAVERLLQRVASALFAGLSAPDQPMATLDLIGSAQRQALVEDWNATEQPLSAHTVTEFVARHAMSAPDAVAAVTPDASTVLTYGALDSRSTVLAHRLVALGVRPESVIGVQFESTPELLVAILAAWKAGAAYVPIDPAPPAARTRQILDDAGVRLVIAAEDRAGDDGAPEVQIISIDDGVGSRSGPLPVADPRRLAYVMYTSGSTGRPKGVMVEHRSLTNYLLWAAAHYRAAEGAGIPVCSSPVFDLAVTSLLLPLVCGQRVVMHPSMQTLDGFSASLGEASDFGIVKSTPSHALALADALPSRALGTLARCLVVGGEALRESHLARWREQAPVTRLINEYGPTEATVGCCVYETRSVEPGLTVPIGRPIANARLYLLDADLQPVPDEIAGELYIAGVGLARGYRNLPADTASRFLPDPFSEQPGERMYRTSDLAIRRQDGNLEFIGRLDRQVKVRGYRIEPGEVEAALATIPGVKAAAAVRIGDGHLAQIGCWIAVEGSALPLRVLRQHLAATLPDYMVPHSITVVAALPLTPNGKVDYAKLQPAASHVSATTETAPATAPEAALLSIWRDVLDEPGLGLHDNFLEFGGDSIVSIRVVGKARQAGWKILPSQVFEYPTVSSLAAMAQPWVDTTATGADGDEVPLTPVQQRFLGRAGTGIDRFSQTRLIEMTRPVAVDSLAAALGAVVHRHDALRLRFARHDGVWRQTVAPEETAALMTAVAPTAPTTAAREQEWQQAQERCVAGLGVAGPMVQAAMMTPGNGGSAQLFIAVHHLAIDHLSWNTLLEDLEKALVSPDALGSPGTPFSVWARHLTRSAAEGGFDADARHWLSRHQNRDAGDAVLVTNERTVDVARTLVELDAAETAAIVHGIHAAFNTDVQDALLTAMTSAMLAETGEAGLRIALESSGREAFAEALDVTRTIGWFTAIAPAQLHVDLDEPPVRQLVRVKDQRRGLRGDGTAFDAARLWSPDAALRQSLSAVPLPAVGFNYLGRVDGETSGHGLFRPLPGGFGELRPLDAFSQHRVELTALVVNGRLVTEFLWTNPSDHGAFAARVGARYASALRALIADCGRHGGPGLTASDFSMVALDEAALAAVLNEVARGEDPHS